ncbi:hypothetical protein PENSPDRAFT_749667 [Peniophora sp. CONT]|nr:hypothetical protein PENSPDRAFT_749667 [Peniophora sp. CONT]
MSIRFATDLFDSLDSLPPLVLYAFPRPSPRRTRIADWSLKAGDVLPYLALIPGFTGRGAANRAYLDVKNDIIRELSRCCIARNQSFDATSTLFKEQEDLIAQICRVVKLDHPYMEYFQEDWALRAMLWSIVWHGRYIRRSARVANARGARAESVNV